MTDPVAYEYIRAMRLVHAYIRADHDTTGRIFEEINGCRGCLQELVMTLVGFIDTQLSYPTDDEYAEEGSAAFDTAKERALRYLDTEITHFLDPEHFESESSS